MKTIALAFIFIYILLIAGIMHESTELDKHFPTETQFGGKHR